MNLMSEDHRKLSSWKSTNILQLCSRGSEFVIAQRYKGIFVLELRSDNTLLILEEISVVNSYLGILNPLDLPFPRCPR